MKKEHSSNSCPLNIANENLYPVGILKFDHFSNSFCESCTVSVPESYIILIPAPKIVSEEQIYF